MNLKKININFIEYILLKDNLKLIFYLFMGVKFTYIVIDYLETIINYL